MFITLWSVSSLSVVSSDICISKGVYGYKEEERFLALKTLVLKHSPP